MTFLVFCRAHIRNYAVLWSSDSKNETFIIVQHCWLSDKALCPSCDTHTLEKSKVVIMIFVFILRGEIMIHNVSLFPVRLFCTLKLFLLPRDTVTFRSHVDITEDSGRQDQVRYLSKTFKSTQPSVQTSASLQHCMLVHCIAREVTEQIGGFSPDRVPASQVPLLTCFWKSEAGNLSKSPPEQSKPIGLFLAKHQSWLVGL